MPNQLFLGHFKYLRCKMPFLLLGLGLWANGGCRLADTPIAAAPVAAPNRAPAPNRIDVPINPQLSGDGRLIASAIQKRNRVDVIDANGQKDYLDQLAGNEVRFWNAKTLTPLRPLPLPSTPAQLALSPDASLLAISGDEFRVVDVVTRKVLWSQNDARSIVPSSEPVEQGMKVVYAPHGLSHPVFSPDGRSLAAWDIAIDADKGTRRVTGYIFDARTGAITSRWGGLPGDLNGIGVALRFSPDSRLLASTELQTLVYSAKRPYARPQIRRVSDGKLLRTFPIIRAGIGAFAFDNRLLLLIASEQYGTDVKQIDALTGKVMWSHTGTVFYSEEEKWNLLTIEKAFYSADRTRIAITFRGSKSVEILDARSGKLLQVSQVSSAPGGPYTDDGAFAFAPGGGALLVMKQGIVSLHKIK